MIEPNINGEMYRKMTPADRPPIPDRHLQFILVYDEKNAVLGGSNMTDRYWSGTVWYYDDTTDFDRAKAFGAIRTDSGVCCGAFLEQNKFIVGEDSGVLQVLFSMKAADTDSQEVQSLGYTCQHDDSIMSISVFANKQHIVTGGMDYCIKVWNIADLISTYTYHSAHTNIVTCVDVQPNSEDVFVSTSLDSEALMWDVRQPKPAHSILKKTGCGLTSASWNVASNNIAIGGVDGSIILVDIRMLDSSIVQDSVIFSRPIHKLLFNPHLKRSSYVACCCDDNIVKVLDTNKEFSLVYMDDHHKDFVRGLAWHENDLYSCSWDDTVYKHLVQSHDEQ